MILYTITCIWDMWRNIDDPFHVLTSAKRTSWHFLSEIYFLGSGTSAASNIVPFYQMPWHRDSPCLPTFLPWQSLGYYSSCSKKIICCESPPTPHAILHMSESCSHLQTHPSFRSTLILPERGCWEAYLLWNTPNFFSLVTSYNLYFLQGRILRNPLSSQVTLGNLFGKEQ